MLSRKGMGAVVSTSLLLVVAVGAIVGFQSWYQDFSSRTFTDVGQKSEAGAGSSGIEAVVGSNIYFKNGFSENITINSVKIGDNDCGINGSYDGGIKSLTLGNNCTQNLTTSTPDVIITTDKGVFIKKIYLKNAVVSSSQTTTSSLDCSGLTGGEWIVVPGNAALNTSDFCVMKYEAKEDSSGLCPTGDTANCPVSQAAGNPWVSITWNAAKIECGSLGTDYHLITDNEWVTIAKLAENDATNWNSSVVGTGGMFRGNVNLFDGISCGSNVVLDGNTAGTNCLTGSRNKRTLNISGNLIWDLSGNVWEWIDEWVYSNSTLGSPYRYHGGDQQWMSYSSDDGTTKIASLVPALKIPSNGWNANNGMGRYCDGTSLIGAYNNVDEGQSCISGYCSPTAVFIRGGSWLHGAYAGAFALYLNIGPSSLHTSYGFRCSYAP